MDSSFLRFLDHTQRRTTVGGTPLDEWSARRRDLYLATHDSHNRQTSMPLVGFEPTISAGERPQTYALDRAATWTGSLLLSLKQNSYSVQTGPGAHPASCTMDNGSFPGVKSGRGVTLTPHPLLVPWSWKSRAIPLLPLWAVRPVQSLSACTEGAFYLYL